MNTADKMFVDPKPVTGRKEDFDLKKLKDVYHDLSEYLKMPIEEISRHYWQDRESADKEEQKLIEKADTEKEVIEYYKNTRQYLYELTLWEAQKDKQREFKKLYLFCRRFNIKKILDFGGGTGGLCIYLNQRGLQCDYLDIAGETYNFAKWRFDRYKIFLRVLNGFEDIFLSYYDGVVAYDVFEHMFDLPGTIKKINASLILGGYLLSMSTFSGGGLHLLKNQAYQDIKLFCSLLADNGFEFMGRLKADRFSGLLNKIGLRYLLLFARINKRLKYGGNFLIHKKISNLIG